MRELRVTIESWPIAGSFTISRGSRTEAVVAVAEISEGGVTGRGECVPYARYGETVEGVADFIREQAPRIRSGTGREALLTGMPAGAARNAIDCALWDLEAKSQGRRAWDLAGLARPAPVTTCYTISLGMPEVMAEATRKAAGRPLLKIKLGGEGDPERIAAVRAAAPDARLVIDANEAWTEAVLADNLAACEKAGVLLIEQPLPAHHDAALAGVKTPIVICADESLHDRAGLAELSGRYGAINIKLDKAGGLTEALLLAEEAKRRGLKIMVGCMLGTSLGMAPATLLTGGAAFVDLDGPLLLAKDRVPGLSFENSAVHAPEAALWG